MTTTAAKHFTARTMRPIGRADTGQDMTPLAAAVLARIRVNRNNTGAGSWVLGSPLGDVYVLPDDASYAALLDAHHDWIAGLFDVAVPAPGEAARFPTVGELFDAMTQQFIDCGFVTEQEIYDEIRMAE